MSVSVTQHKQFIGGEWVDSSSGETMEVLNPATGEVIAEVPRGTAEDVERAVEAAKKAWDEWRFKTPKDRMELLLKLADVIDENADELARLESQNVGKPTAIAVDEMPFSADNLRFFAGAARNLEGKSGAEYVEGYTSISGASRSGSSRGSRPGTTRCMMAVWKIGPALAAGNVQIIKPAEQTPLTTLRLAELAQEFLPGRPAGRHRRRHPGRGCARPAPGHPARLAHGRRRHREAHRANAADTLKRVHLELGGKAPMVVLDDADPATVAEAIKIGGYWNSGQDCTASSRILVGEAIYDDVLSETVSAVEAMKVADPAEGRRHRHGPADLGGAARARARLPRARDEVEGDDRHGRRVGTATAASSSSRRSSPT